MEKPSKGEKAKEPSYTETAELGQIYAVLDLIRSSARNLSNMVGRNMEQQDRDSLDRISAIVNGLIDRVMACHDRLVEDG